MDGFLFFGVGLLLVAVGVFHRRSLFRAYASDCKQYTGTTPMKIIHLEESTMTTWEEQEDGTRRECYSTVHTPTYEYTVDGQTYQYVSRQDTCRPVGACVTGYYDPPISAAFSSSCWVPPFSMPGDTPFFTISSKVPCDRLSSAQKTDRLTQDKSNGPFFSRFCVPRPY